MTAIAGASSASPIQRSLFIASAYSSSSSCGAAFAPARYSRESGNDEHHAGVNRFRRELLLDHHPLVALDDIGEVFRQRERAAVARQIGRRDVGEELVPARLVHFRLDVLGIDP